MEAKLDLAYTAIEEIDKKMAELQDSKEVLLAQGKASQVALDGLMAEKAAILQHGQTQMGQNQQPALECLQVLGLAPEQLVQFPDLAELFQQMQSMVAQIKTRGLELGGGSEAETNRQTQIDGSQLPDSTAAASAQVGTFMLDTKKEGPKGGGRQRSAPYPGGAGAAQPKEEQATQGPPHSTGKDLGMEGDTADVYDSQLLDGGQQLP